HFFRKIFHLLFKGLQGTFQVSFDDLPNILYLVMVFLFPLMAFTWPQTIAQMVFQAHFVLSCRYFFFRKIIITGAQRIQALHKIQKRPNGLHTGIGSIIFGTVLDELSGGKDSWEAFILDAYPRVGLIVLE